ncbi:MAG: RICIN domain-containing protein [Bacteroidales bacterium]|nr:RICIN domain-containing protein [Bacteroidales bacterium]MCF8336764.1 RICIN domain-containing protein [Bacteroidales bacterium]
MKERNDRFIIRAKHSNKAIDIKGGGSKIHDNGPDLHQWSTHKGKSQQ